MLKATRAAALVGIAALAATTLAGCFLLPNNDSKTGLDTEFDQDFAQYFEQDLEWEDCTDGFRCADMKVPVDWADADSDTVEIALIVHPAGKGSKGPLFVNPGGPGGSGVDFVQTGLDYAVSSDLSDSFDIVGWDPRGVGDSTPVTCYGDADKDELLYGTFEDPYFTEEWIDDLVVVESDFADACAAETGDLLGHVDTVSTANDLELMRYLLGDKPLDYLGYSYGTYIGAMYAELFPETVGHLVLDGAVDPQLNAFDELIVQMGGFESAYRAYLADCLEGSGCPFTGSLDEGLAQTEAVLDSVDGLGIVASDGRELDSATVGTAVAMALYSEDYWTYLSDMFRELKEGSAATAFLLADSYNEREADGSYGSNSFEVYTATTCLDNDFASDTESTLERLDQIDEAVPTIGKYIALDDYAALDTACGDWPFAPADAPTTFDASGAAPILVIGTSNDPATPYAWAKSLSEQLESGVLISVEGEGHTAYNQGNTCVDTTVDDYFLNDTVPSSDPNC